MFDNPDALASTLTKREVLQLLMLHAAVTQFQPQPFEQSAVFDFVDQLVEAACARDPEEIEAAPAPEEAEPVVGQRDVADEALERFPDRAEGGPPRARPFDPAGDPDLLSKGGAIA